MGGPHHFRSPLRLAGPVHAFELENMYTGKRFKNLSMILNGTESTGGRYGYRYGYHYGYASYYGSKDK